MEIAAAVRAERLREIMTDLVNGAAVVVRGAHEVGRGGAMTAVTGDCLFPGGVGKTWRDGDFDRLLDGVTARVFDVYDDSTIVYPGHGDDTTLGAERPHLAEWRERGW